MPYQDIEKQKEFRRKKEAHNRAAVQELKSAPCLDCGQTYPHYCMEFDHREGTQKTNTVGALAHKGLNSKRLQDELAKVDLVCACCHKIRTHNRRIKNKTTVAFA